MISTPNLLSGDDEGRKTSGVASLTFAEGGKWIALDSETLLAFKDTSELLHNRDDWFVEVVAEEDRTHEPAIASVVPFVLRQRHATQPGE